MGDEDKTSTDPETDVEDKPEVKEPPKVKAPEVAFKTKAEFHAEVDRKTKSAVSKAVEDVRADLFSKFGVEAPEELDSIVEKVKSAKAAITETDKLRNDLSRATKQILAKDETIGMLKNWKHVALKQRAIQQFASKVVDIETLTSLLEPKMVVNDEDDVVTGPNGKSLEDIVDDILKTKTFLKVPEFKTQKTEQQRVDPDTVKKKPANEPEKRDDGTATQAVSNGEPKTIAEAVVAALRAQKAQEAGGP